VDGIRHFHVTGVQTCALPICRLFELPPATRVFVCHDYGQGGREVACETSSGAQRRDNIHVRDGIDEAAFVRVRTERDATLPVPRSEERRVGQERAWLRGR